MRRDDHYPFYFGRNTGIYAADDVEKIRKARIGIAGLGGSGGYSLLFLVHMGFEHFKIADLDSYEEHNKNRQIGAFARNIGRPKTESLLELAKGLNPYAEIEVYEEGITLGNARAFVEGTDFVIETMDFNVPGAKFALHDAAVDAGIHISTSPSPAYGAPVYNFGPKTPTFAQAFGLDPIDTFKDPQHAKRFIERLALPNLADYPAGAQGANSLSLLQGGRGRDTSHDEHHGSEHERTALVHGGPRDHALRRASRAGTQDPDARPYDVPVPHHRPRIIRLEELTFGMRGGMGAVGGPRVVDLGTTIDLAALGISTRARVFALLGGHNPSGSLKDAAVARVLDAAVACGALLPGQPIAEISNGSMARSLVWAAGRLGSPAYLSFPGGCQASIDGIVGAGKARFLAFDPPSTSGHPIVDFFAGFEAACRDRGYFYLDQTRNKAFALAYDALVPEVLETLARRHGVAKLDSLVVRRRHGIDADRARPRNQAREPRGMDGRRRAREQTEKRSALGRPARPPEHSGVSLGRRLRPSRARQLSPRGGRWPPRRVG